MRDQSSGIPRSITGDVATGKKVFQAAAKSVKRTHLELGGKAPVIVSWTMQIWTRSSAASALAGVNAGQTALPPAACWRENLRPAGRSFRCRLYGISSFADDTENEIGPLISKRSATASPHLVERGFPEHRHMEVTTGGKQHGGTGFFYEPTVAGAL